MTNAYTTRRTTRKELRQQINQSSKLRRQHLIARVIALELNRNYKQGKDIKKIITIEDQCSLHAAVKHYFNPPNKSSLSKVKIPVGNDDWNNIPKDKSVQWKPITESNKIEKVLIKRNISHPSQAEGTLFATPSMIDLIGKDGCAPGVDKIIDGTYDQPIDKISPLQLEYFKNLQWKSKQELKSA